MLLNQSTNQNPNLGAFNRSMDRLAQIHVNDDGDIQEPFMHFPVGTGRFDIWQYLSERYNVPLETRVKQVA